MEVERRRGALILAAGAGANLDPVDEEPTRAQRLDEVGLLVPRDREVHGPLGASGERTVGAVGGVDVCRGVPVGAVGRVGDEEHGAAGERGEAGGAQEPEAGGGREAKEHARG